MVSKLDVQDSREKQGMSIFHQDTLMNMFDQLSYNILLEDIPAMEKKGIINMGCKSLKHLIKGTESN